MRKMLLCAMAAVLVVAAATSSAEAFSFAVGDNLGKMSDWGSFYDPDTGAPKAVGDFAVGDLDRTLLRVTELYAPPIETLGNRYYDGSPELVGLLADLEIGDVRVLRAPGTNSVDDPGKFEVDLVSAGRFDVADSAYTGGRIDMWQDVGDDMTPVGSGGYPADWGAVDTSGFVAGWDANPFDAGEYDTFPTGTDGTATPLLSGTLVDPNDDGVLLTLTLDFEDGTGATNQGYIHILYNPEGHNFASAYAGGEAEIAFFNNFKFFPNATIPYEPVFDNPGSDDIFWATSSQDPINFTIDAVVPEPASLTLLGTGLIGLLYAKRRRKKE